MMETKHTPGKWAVTKEDHRLKVHPVGWQNSVICEWKEGRTGAGRGGTRHYTGNYPPYAEGDARLIAAAPDLLQAARELLARLDQLDPLGFNTPMRQWVRETIANATQAAPDGAGQGG